MAISRKYLIALSVLLCCVYGRTVVGHSLREKRQSTTDPKMIDEFVDEVSADAEVDLVLLIDRSSGMGRSWFYRYEKTFAQSLIMQYVNMHPNYVRLAVVTFGKDVSTPINYISTPSSNDNLKTKLFYAPDPAWDDVVFYTDPDRSGATDLVLGLTRVKDILDDGRDLRPSAQQIVLTISDGNYDNQVGDPLSIKNQLDLVAKLYACGLGPWLQTGNIRELAKSAVYYAPYDDGNSESSGTYGSWMDMLSDLPRSGDANTFPLYYPIEESYCDPPCNSTEGQLCYTDTRSGHANCVCPPGYYLDIATDTCQVCVEHRYKSTPGNQLCARCPSAYVTASTGSTSMLNCTCNQYATDCDEADLELMNGCEPNDCNVGQQCFNMLDSGTCSTELCLPGFESLSNDCMSNIDDCENNECVTSNYGTQCLDMVDDYLCVCPIGYFGRYCEINIDECVEGMCDNNATCTDQINNFYCNCSDIPYDGTYCQNLITTTTTTTTPTPIYVTPAAITEDGFPLVIVIGGAAGGFVFIVIIVAIIISIVMYRRRKAAEREAANVKEELDTLKRERRGRQRQTFTKSISQAFQGFWKRRTLRSSMYENHESPAQGAPSAPPSRRPDLLGEAEPVNTVDEFMMDDQGIKATSGMDGWKSYLNDLQRAHVIESGMIADIDGGRYACTSKFTADPDEVERLDNDLHLAKSQTTMMVLDQEYLILERTNDATTGIATDGSSLSVQMSRTKKYLIVLIASVDTDKGRARLNKELQWITDHIRGEGY